MKRAYYISDNYNRSFRSVVAARKEIMRFNTGMDTPNTLVGNQTLLGWASYLLSDWVAYAGKSNDYEVIKDLGAENVVVASPSHDSKIAMDKTDKATLDKVTRIWTEYYDRNRDVFRNFVQL